MPLGIAVAVVVFLFNLTDLCILCIIHNTITDFMKNLLKQGYPDWTFVRITTDYSELVKNGAILWCKANLKSSWFIASPREFAFEDATDALAFKIHFDFKGQ